MKIIPSILTDDRRQAKEWLLTIKDLGKYDTVQIDFIDETYHNQTVGAFDINLDDYKPLQFDLHLMVAKENMVGDILGAKEIGFSRIIPQIEQLDHPENYTCLAVDLETPIEIVEPFKANLDLILVMDVDAGFGGQEFDERVVEKIKRLSDWRNKDNLGFKIAADGGIQKDHLPILEGLGVDEVVIGMPRVLEF